MEQITEETITQAEYTGKEKYLNNVWGKESEKERCNERKNIN